MTLALTDRVAAAWEVLRERVPDTKALEFADLLLAFEVNEANGNGALSFNANQGHPQEWAVRSETVVRISPLTRKAKRA